MSSYTGPEAQLEPDRHRTGHLGTAGLSSMSTLLSIFGNAGSALAVLQQALSVIQNNVSNASTPGYATQRLNITAQPFDAVASGAAGGVAARGLISSRDSYADTEVQRQLQTLGAYTAQAQSTSNIQNFFDASGNEGRSFRRYHQSVQCAFSAWSDLSDRSDHCGADGDYQRDGVCHFGASSYRSL